MVGGAGIPSDYLVSTQTTVMIILLLGLWLLLGCDNKFWVFYFAYLYSSVGKQKFDFIIQILLFNSSDVFIL